jgi:hypothetical protein
MVKQYLLSAGLAAEKSSRATNMVYTQMLFALAFDKVIFGTTPGLLSITGSSLILGSAIYVALQKGNAKSTDSNKTEEGHQGYEPDDIGLVERAGHETEQHSEEELGLVDNMDIEIGEDEPPKGMSASESQ